MAFDLRYVVTSPRKFLSEIEFSEIFLGKPFYEIWKGLPPGLDFERVTDKRICEAASEEKPGMVYRGMFGRVWVVPEAGQALLKDPETFLEASHGNLKDSRLFDVYWVTPIRYSLEESIEKVNAWNKAVLNKRKSTKI